MTLLEILNTTLHMLQFLKEFACLRQSNNIFVILVNLTEDSATVDQSLHFWFSFIQHQRFQKAFYAVVGSHYDTFAGKESILLERRTLLTTFCASISQVITGEIGNFVLDCRNPRSSGVGKFNRQIVEWISMAQENTSFLMKQVCF